MTVNRKPNCLSCFHDDSTDGHGPNVDNWTPVRHLIQSHCLSDRCQKVLIIQSWRRAAAKSSSPHRPTRSAQPAPATHRLSIQPMTTPRPMTAAAGMPVSPPCKLLAAGFCKRGQSCTFGYSSSVQQPAPAPHSVQTASCLSTAVGHRKHAAGGGSFGAESLNKLGEQIKSRFKDGAASQPDAVLNLHGRWQVQ